MNLKKKFLHTIDIYVPYRDRYGDTTIASIDTSVQCFILGAEKRYLGNDGIEFVADKSVYFLPTASLDLGYVLKNGKNKYNVTILDEATIVSVDKIGKPKENIKLIEVYARSEATASVTP